MIISLLASRSAWALALPAEFDASERRLLMAGFAAELVSRYGVIADVTIHAPHREGDQRNWHAHVLTTTRRLEPSGLTDKTRVLDAKQTGGPEIEALRARWAEMQNHAREPQGHEVRVDHRSLAVQREAALAQGQELRAEELDRAPEVKLGSVVSAIERREAKAAKLEERDYAPVTERGAAVQAVRQERARVELARETHTHAREDGADRVTAGLAALRAAAQKHEIDREHGRGTRRRPGASGSGCRGSWTGGSAAGRPRSHGSMGRGTAKTTSARDSGASWNRR